MLKATAGKVMPTTVIGSLPRPSWYTENLGLKSFLDAMVISRFREQYVDTLRSNAVMVMDVDGFDNRRAQDIAVERHGHSNNMIGSTFHRRRIANTLDTAVITSDATRAIAISRNPMVMPRWRAASATP